MVRPSTVRAFDGRNGSAGGGGTGGAKRTVPNAESTPARSEWTSMQVQRTTTREAQTVVPLTVSPPGRMGAISGEYRRRDIRQRPTLLASVTLRLHEVSRRRAIFLTGGSALSATARGPLVGQRTKHLSRHEGAS